MSRLDTKARRLLQLRAQAALAQRAADAAKDARDVFELEFWSELEDLGLRTFTMDDGTRLERRARKDADVVDEALLLRELEARGVLDNFTKPALTKRTLNQYVRTLTENGEELPLGLGWRTKRYISVTKKPR